MSTKVRETLINGPQSSLKNGRKEQDGEGHGGKELHGEEKSSSSLKGLSKEGGIDAKGCDGRRRTPIIRIKNPGGSNRM